jgi:hypothetical protein
MSRPYPPSARPALSLHAPATAIVIHEQRMSFATYEVKKNIEALRKTLKTENQV